MGDGVPLVTARELALDSVALFAALLPTAGVLEVAYVGETATVAKARMSAIP